MKITEEEVEAMGSEVVADWESSDCEQLSQDLLKVNWINERVATTMIMTILSENPASILRQAFVACMLIGYKLGRKHASIKQSSCTCAASRCLHEIGCPAISDV